MTTDEKTIADASPRGAERDDADLGAGDLIGDYVVQSRLAAGGQGVIYAALHRVLRRTAAVKVLHHDLSSSPEALERFTREARVVNQIHHRGIVDIFDIGRLPDGRPYYVMERLEGCSLETLLRLRDRFDAPTALSYMRAICEALTPAHAAGVVHRDRKASNIFVVREGATPEIKLLDFGIAKLMNPEPGEKSLTQLGQRLGSANSMSPEQILGESVDARTDIYSLGVMLFRFVTGSYPFSAATSEEVSRLHLERMPPRPSQLAPIGHGVDAVVLKCLEKKADRRFPDVASFLAALTAVVEGTPRAEQALVSAICVEANLDEGEGGSDGALVAISDTLDRARARDRGLYPAPRRAAPRRREAASERYRPEPGAATRSRRARAGSLPAAHATRRRQRRARQRVGLCARRAGDARCSRGAGRRAVGLRRGATEAQWSSLPARAVDVAQGQELIEIYELRGVVAAGSGDLGGARRIWQEALVLGEKIPNVMSGRLRARLDYHPSSSV